MAKTRKKPGSLTRAAQLDWEVQRSIFKRAEKIRAHPRRYNKSCEGKVVANLFYEPSTRTSASFHAAASRLGASVFSVDDVQFSSLAKGETLEDTIRVLGGYVDAIVLRHPDDDAAERAAEVSTVPVINAGCGSNEHPTQALLDVYTIWREWGEERFLSGLYICFMGDLKNGRTVHSLVQMLRRHEVHNLSFISPVGLELPTPLLKVGDCMYHHLEEAASQLDVLYLTRPQLERMYGDVVGDTYQLHQGDLRYAEDDMIIMHPLPRTDELPKEWDDDPRARYFQQAENGLWVRMALLLGMGLRTFP